MSISHSHRLQRRSNRTQGESHESFPVASDVPMAARRRSPDAPIRLPPRLIPILFVGNSYTFGRVDPVMSYNAANVHDLTRRDERRQSRAARILRASSVGRRSRNLQAVHGPGRSRLRRVDIGAQRRFAARSLSQHEPGRLGSPLQYRQPEVGRRRAAGLERRAAAQPKGLQREPGHFQLLHEQARGLHPTGIKAGYRDARSLNTTEGQLWGGP